MKFSYFFIFLALFFLVGTVSAEDSTEDLTIPFGQVYNLKKPCFNNGTFCSATAVCNITLTYPDGSLFFDNQAMTRQTSYFNISMISSKVNQLGVHPGIMSCTDTGGDIKGSGPDTFNIIVTGDGHAFSVFPIQLSFFIVGLALIIIGKFREDFRMIKHLGSIMILILGVITLWPGYAFINYSTLLGQVVGFSAIGLGFYFWLEDSFSRGRQTEYYEQEEEDDGRFHGND